MYQVGMPPKVHDLTNENPDPLSLHKQSTGGAAPRSVSLNLHDQSDSLFGNFGGGDSRTVIHNDPKVNAYMISEGKRKIQEMIKARN